MIPVRQSTAFECSVGPVLDASGVAVTDCVVADFKLKKTTGNFAALNGSATLTHVSAGTYDLVLTTSDVDTVGLATVAIDDSTNACAPVRLQVIEEVIYDALFAASANAFAGAAGSTTLTALASGSITAAVVATGAIDADAIASDAITSAKIADNAITAAKINADAITAAKIANGAIDAATFAADVDAEILSYLVNDATQIDASALNTATGTTIPAILTDTAEIGVAGAGLTEAGGDGDHLTAINLPNQTMDIVGNITGNLSGSVGSVTAGVTLANDAITAAKFDETTAFPLAQVDTGATAVARTGADSDTLETLSDQLDAKASQASVDDLPTNADLTTALSTADDAVLAQVALVKAVTDKVDDTLEDDGGTFRFTANALEEAPTGGSAPTAAAIADAVWDEAQSDHVGAGSFGLVASEVADILVDTGTTLQGELDGIQADTEDIQNRLPAALVGGRIDATVDATGMEAGAVAAIADGVWEEAIADHSGTAGSTAEALADAGGAGTPPTVGEIADAVWDEATAGHTTSGTFGEQVKTDVDAILADTAELQGDWVNGGRLDNILDARASQASVDDVPTNAELATALGTADDAVLAAIAALNNLSIANIRTAVGLASANLDTQLDALPTNAELATALASADDAVLAAVAAAKAVVDAIKLSTDALPSDPADQSLIIAATTAITNAIAALNNLSAAQVNSEVDQAITDAALASAASLSALAATVAALNNLSSAQAQTAAAAALTAYDPPTNAEMEARTPTAAVVAKLSAHAAGVVTVVIGTGSTPTSIVLDPSTGVNGGAPPALDDTFNGRVLIITSGALIHQATDCTDYVGSTGTLTVTALTGSLAAGTTAVIV